ncbi:extracellular solute-binding protein [Orbaceae bacterium ESL0727]|nr:extracellular solute-binding protein [Orbaceae bacterium ESL0727]
MLRKRLSLIILMVSFVIFPSLLSIKSALAQSKILHVYNWSDYIAPNTVPDFEKLTHIKVIYDVFDSNEVLDGKLTTGNIGYDIVVPTDAFLARQIKIGIYQALDKSKLPNYSHLDPDLMRFVELHDPGARYSIPYMWQSTGIGYNIDKVKEVLGDNAPLDSWDLILKPENLKKLSQCGVAFLDAPSAVFPIVLNYQGKDPNSHNEADYPPAVELLSTLRPYITYFHSSKYINDLASGDICVAIGHSGDVLQAQFSSAKNVKIGYFVPKEGGIISFDMLAIPKEAKNVDEAYQFLNYLLDPKVIANISNQTFFPNVNKDAIPYLKPEILNNPAIYPPKAVYKILFPIKEQPANIDRLMSRLWVKVLTDK